MTTVRRRSIPATPVWAKAMSAFFLRAATTSFTRLLCLLALAAMGSLVRAQPESAIGDTRLASTLNFEREDHTTSPAGWRGGPPETLFVDSDVTHTGKRAARLERIASSPQNFSSLTKSVPMDFAGSRIEFRGFLRTAEVTGYAGLWMRQDGMEGMLEFDNMQRRQLKGTSDWTEYAITLPLNPGGRELFFGVLVAGTGQVWADDLQLLVDGKPIWAATRAEKADTVFDRDREFEHGSKIDPIELTPAQVMNLATLIRVWGFLKYHHPRITAGELHWDFELLRTLPAVLAAGDTTRAHEVLQNWVAGLGDLEAHPGKKLSESDLHLRPDLAWIEDKSLLGQQLSERLRAVHRARHSDGDQFYVSLARGVGNPVFAHEPPYPRIKLPDTGYQLLALARFWNIIRYWFPYRDLIDDNWDAVLAEFIPRIAQARSADAYQLELIALIARVCDTHANLWSSLQVRPPVGDGQLPVIVRFIEDRPVVTELIPSSGETAASLQPGDVILAIDGIAVEALIAEWSPYYAASNEPTRRRDIARFMGRGPIGPAKVKVQRLDEVLDVQAMRVPPASLENPGRPRDNAPCSAFRLLSKDVAYLKLAGVKAAEATDYVEQASGTKGWVIDARQYPSEFMVFALGSHFVAKPTEFARFTTGDLANPGAFSFTRQPLSLPPKAPHYAGRVVILIDEGTQSSGEYTTMAFRVAPGALVIGSTTAAADGNVSQIPLPGGLRTMISGIGVFYPDKRPTQRVGILPDIEVKPTLDGLRAGRDEVLEVAVRQILGPHVSAEELRRMTSKSESPAADSAPSQL